MMENGGLAKNGVLSFRFLNISNLGPSCSSQVPNSLIGQDEFQGQATGSPGPLISKPVAIVTDSTICQTWLTLAIRMPLVGL